MGKDLTYDTRLYMKIGEVRIPPDCNRHRECTVKTVMAGLIGSKMVLYVGSGAPVNGRGPKRQVGDDH